MIPEGKLYTDQYRDLGEQSSLNQNPPINSHVASAAIGFGKFVQHDGDDGEVCPVDGAGVVAGLAVHSSEALNLDENEYAEYDPVAVALGGEFIAACEEDVTRSSVVRVRIAEDKEHGYQEIGFSAEKTTESATGLANDTTSYGAIAVVDGEAIEIDIDGADAQTIADLITAVNTILETKAALAFTDDEMLRVTSETGGANSSVSITDGLTGTTALFASLTDINADFEEAVDGTDEGDADKVPGNLCTTAIAGQTAKISGVTFVGSSDDNGRVPVLLTGNFELTAD